ncbi:MAG TPA: hypothetical protein VII45_01410 [Solirubrobacterales bacterium]
MEGSDRDSTQDWLLPEEALPPLLSELELRIDEAVATARASEAAVITVGASAREAATQARRAADVAERAAATALDVQKRSETPAPPRQDENMRRFSDRADRVVRRLRQLERLPSQASRRANGEPAR